MMGLVIFILAKVHSVEVGSKNGFSELKIIKIIGNEDMGIANDK